MLTKTSRFTSGLCAHIEFTQIGPISYDQGPISHLKADHKTSNAAYSIINKGFSNIVDSK
jgi:hypothetical protein